MRTRLLFGFLSVGVAVLLVVLLSASIGSAAPAVEGVNLTSNNGPANSVPASSEPASINYRRLISVPFGIAITQEINSAGNQVLVNGHGNCWAEGQMFDLHVRVAQSTTNAFAEGHTIDNCSEAVQQWDAPAQAEEQAKFEEGPARACAQATEWGTHGVVEEHAWCKDITLEKVSGPIY